MTQHSQ